jgi:PAS domain S-box-containing protein
LMNRGDFIEETYYSFSYSPIRDESGTVAGLFCPSTEVTAKVINARRLGTLSELSADALLQKTTEAACASVVATLAKNRDDIPFAMLYLVDAESQQARLERVCGLGRGVSGLTPDAIDLTGGDGEPGLWRLAEVVKTRQSQVVSVREVEGLPLGVAQQRLCEAMVLPVSTRGEGGTLGVLVAGVNPARKLEREYRTFYELVAGQIATAIQNARAAEDERKRLEALAEIDRAKTAFFSNVSHEFRTPLTLMLGPVEELLSRAHTDLSPAAKSQLELVNRNGSRLLRLVNTLLDFSRIEAGRMQAIYQPTDLAAFTVELASVFRSATEKAGLRLDLDCPKLGEPVFVDRGMWEKIVLNLISNAFKFTFEGTIALGLSKVGDTVELRVHDTGVGIPAQETSRLFDRFHRIENTRSRTHEGSGIGLALVQELVKLHGGNVRVESVLHEGSTFIVSLPLGSAHLPGERIGGTRSLASTALGAAPFVEEALRWLPESEYREVEEEILPGDELIPVPCPPLAHGDGTSAKRPHILVADDNADMRRYLARLLGERYEVQAVADGQAALAAVRERCPELVLSDVMMPNLDGFGLLHELRSEQSTRTIPIILLSARAGEESRVEGMEHGADDYLIKPFSARELLARVQTHLEMARVRKQGEEALRRRTEQFETLINEAPLGVYLVDGDFRIRAMNPPALRAFGNIRNPLSRDFAEVIRILWPEAYADEIVARIRHTLETGEAQFVPEWIQARRDRGVREIYEWQISRIPLPEGGYGVVCYFQDITRQVQAREAIAESEERLRLAQKVGHSGTWESNIESGRLISSPELLELFGLGPEAASADPEPWRRIVHPEDLVDVDKALAQAIATHSEFHVEFRIMRGDSGERWIESTAQIFYDDDGKPVRIVGISTDITKRKQAERANGLLAAIVDSSDDAIVSKGLDGVITSWNKAAERMLGYGAIEAIGRHISLIIPPDRQHEETRILERLRRGERIEHFETVRRHKDGTLRDISLTISPVKDGAGKIVGASKVARDITERRQAEERERRMTAETVAATAKFRAVFEQTPVFAGIMTLDGIILDANQLCLEACGYRGEDVLGKPFWETGWWRKSPEVQAKIRGATVQAAQGEPYREILTYHWADDSEHLVDFAMHPIRDHEGQILFLHPTGVDITDLKRAEEKYRILAETLEAEVRVRTKELEQRNVEVVRQSEQLRDLSSRLLQAQDEERRHIARELHDSAGQILAALGMTLGQAAQQAPRDGVLFAKSMEESQQLVQQLSQEIRTMSYLLHPPLLEETGLAGALHWYIQGLKERNGLEIALRVPEDFARLPREMELVMFRLVQECLTNIHRHSGSKSAEIRIARDEESLTLEVEDEGEGISAERLAEIQSQGSGVGIRGMRERVRHFGGHMQIESNGRGTKILFKFPFSQSVAANKERVRQQERVAQ